MTSVFYEVIYSLQNGLFPGSITTPGKPLTVFLRSNLLVNRTSESIFARGVVSIGMCVVECDLSKLKKNEPAFLRACIYISYSLSPPLSYSRMRLSRVGRLMRSSLARALFVSSRALYRAYAASKPGMSFGLPPVYLPHRFAMAIPSRWRSSRFVLSV